jgi:hypothetical protein
MQRTAEEFVQQLPDGRWVVADTLGLLRGEVACVRKDPRIGWVMGPPMPEVAAAADHRIPKYKLKSSAKRVAQRMLEEA